MKDAQALLEVKKLKFAYSEKPVLRNINLSLYPGEVLGLIGESGSGKTSLIKLLGGLLDPLGGEIYYQGEKMTGPAGSLIPGHPDIKVVNQDFDLMPFLSVEENMLRHARSASDSAQRRISGHYRQRLKLKQLSQQRAVDTSGGQKQRVAMGTALAAKPRVLLLDEPFSNLDYPLKQELIALLQSEWKPAAMVLVTHEPSDLLALATRVIALEKGRIIQTGSTTDIYQHPKTAAIGRLLGPLNHFEGEELQALGHPGSEALIRPHQLQIAEQGLAAEVTAIKYQGSHYLHQCLALPAKRPFQLHSRERISPGSNIRLRWVNS